ncbi:DUF2207 domain-containing protein [Pseudomonas sp. TTU2014-080ASC]|uniref:DUF2207 domain-containing protein n=1 Tax=Pseudomonas sp. TTU2014-080ASC TaxID=1729724 RepID=UPI0007186CE0|nr:DUF2207 domain-containing protein [Pseudomonas sp. TTU2014-080ASC]KRW61109.1 hypothetical protein AO726_07160 [Pseudomonas sp. TTU2014-080ASC]
MHAIFLRLAFCLLCLPLLASAEETIKDFDVTLQVQADGKLLITERIRVQAEGRQIKRGIYRDVPESYAERGELIHRAPVTLISVARDGQSEPVRSERTGSWRRFYIGSADQELTPGEYTYELNYQVEQALYFHPGTDELYWNVTGNEWSFPIEQVSAEVLLPEGVVINNLSAYTGSTGDKGDAFEILEREDNRVRVRTTQPLAAYQGLTIALDWPQGVIARPSSTEALTLSLRGNLGLVVGALALFGLAIFYHRTWKRVGRDPDKGLVVPLFQPPQGIAPVMAGYLWFRGFRKQFTAPKAMSIWLTEMAISKQLSLSEENKGKRFTLTAGEAASDLPDYSQQMLNALFGGKKPETQLTIGKAHVPRLEVALDRLKSHLIQHAAKWYKSNTGRWVVGVVWAAVGSLLTLFLSAGALDVSEAMIGLVCVSVFLPAPLVLMVSSKNAAAWRDRIVLAILALIFGWPVCLGLYILLTTATLPINLLLISYMLLVVVYRFLLPAPSPEARVLLDKLEGYREYLRLGESELLELAGNVPAMSIALYEQHLPYAMALGVEDKWTERFSNALSKGLLGPNHNAYRPSWYRGRIPLESPSALSSALSGGLLSAAALSSRPPSNSGGGGSRGGGSSGGGRGGGGGGGW